MVKSDPVTVGWSYMGGIFFLIFGAASGSMIFFLICLGIGALVVVYGYKKAERFEFSDPITVEESPSHTEMVIAFAQSENEIFSIANDSTIRIWENNGGILTQKEVFYSEIYKPETIQYHDPLIIAIDFEHMKVYKQTEDQIDQISPDFARIDLGERLHGLAINDTIVAQVSRLTAKIYRRENDEFKIIVQFNDEFSGLQDVKFRDEKLIFLSAKVEYSDDYELHSIQTLKSGIIENNRYKIERQVEYYNKNDAIDSDHLALSEDYILIIKRGESRAIYYDNNLEMVREVRLAPHNRYIRILTTFDNGIFYTSNAWNAPPTLLFYNFKEDAVTIVRYRGIATITAMIRSDNEWVVGTVTGSITKTRDREFEFEIIDVPEYVEEVHRIFG